MVALLQTVSHTNPRLDVAVLVEHSAPTEAAVSTVASSPATTKHVLDEVHEHCAHMKASEDRSDERTIRNALTTRESLAYHMA